MNSEQNETKNSNLTPRNQAKPRTMRMKLVRLFALLLPGSGDCRALSTEEEIIACMAKKHPTLFIS
ncbi:MAG: hypothetical protein HGB29_09755 [Chlorobiaceae bacterium]|nr:hypothetical protein [Chlorobiaceae bacterium]NTW75135.1 hypothetical protein [Chlorobiaceae bacterium]